jgi:gliding motility-associatede transport system auxiliary component
MKWNRNEIAQFMALIGIACLVAGYLRFTIQNELLLTAKILLIAGGVLTLAAAVIGYRAFFAFFSKRSSQLGSNAIILSVAVLAILVVLNFLSFRHSKRFDLTSEKLFSLSDQTRKVVGGLQKDVNVVRFARPTDTTPDSQHFSDLMIEYKHLSPHFKFQEVNPQEKPDVAQQYGAKRINDVIVASGDQKVPLEGGFEGGGISEADVTNAILKVTRETSKKVCFVTGHGEKALDDGSVEGYAQMGENLKKETYTTQTMSLVEKNGVPSDCDVLVIAGPSKPFFPQEVAMVQKYLDDGGKALIEVDPDTDSKLDPIFQEWNIKVGNNVVIDASGMGQLMGAGPEIPLVVNYGDSPITKSLQRQMTYFPVARTVSIADKSKTDPSNVELLMTSPQSFTKAKLEHQVKYDPKTDQLGPLSLGVAGTESKGENKSARLVVIGNSAFPENQVLGGPGSDGDLFLNTINWLAQDENLISIRPKPETSRHITLTLAQETALAWIDRFFLPGIVIIMGAALWLKRR